MYYQWEIPSSLPPEKYTDVWGVPLASSLHFVPARASLKSCWRKHPSPFPVCAHLCSINIASSPSVSKWVHTCHRSSWRFVWSRHHVFIPYAAAGTLDNTVCLGLINAFSIIMTSDVFPGPQQLLSYISSLPSPLNTGSVCWGKGELLLGGWEWLAPMSKVFDTRPFSLIGSQEF